MAIKVNKELPSPAELKKGLSVAGHPGKNQKAAGRGNP